MAQFTVTNPLDQTVEGLLSLREAIEAANSTLNVPDEIVFASSLSGTTITLTSGALYITDSLIISGLGANLLTVSGNNSSNVFYIDDGKNSQIDVTINGLTVTQGSRYDGGGIYNKEKTTITNSAITQNRAINEDNEPGSGGGIYNDASGSLVIQDSTISGNLASWGGGIYNLGVISIDNSTISGNSAIKNGDYGGYGGGIDNRKNATITNSTISGNSALTSGGGFYNKNRSSHKVTIDNTIINNNTGGDIVDEGSGMFMYTPPLDLPKISINSVTVIDDASVISTAIFTVSLSSLSSTTVTVDYKTRNGSALAGEDYTAVEETLSFAANQPTATIEVLIRGDTTVEADETFFLNLSNASSNATIAVSQGSATITTLDPAQYGASYGDLIEGYGYNLPALTDHYLEYGITEGRSPDLFDEYRYLAGYDDLIDGYRTDVGGATQHYLLAGSAFSDGAEGRDPLAFKSDIYIASHPDLIGGVQTIANYADKLEYAGFHYVTAGRGEGRAKEIFNPSAYLAKYPELAAFGSLEALTQHYIEHGYFEGRLMA